MRHPSADEPVTDQIFRYFNEMDWSGQNKAKWISIIIQTIAAVSNIRVLICGSRSLASELPSRRITSRTVCSSTSEHVHSFAC